MPSYPAPPFDAELNETLVQSPDVLLESLTSDNLERKRAWVAGLTPPIEEVLAGRAIAHTEHTVPGLDGAPDIVLSVFSARDRSLDGPAIYHTHGGGMVLGDRFSGVAQFLDLVETTGLVLVSVEYRRAPEHPDPAPVDDCFAGLVWTAAHAEELGFDPTRLVVAGASAGGGLAAGIALRARDQGGPSLAGQMLICPMLDDRNETISSRQIDGIGIWDRNSNTTGWVSLLGDRRSTEHVSIYAAPARASDLSGLPPTFIDVGSAEVFRDESVTYASGIWASGGVAELHVWPGGFHGFNVLAPEAALGRQANEAQLRWLDRIFSKRS